MVVNLFSIVDGCFMSWTSHHPNWSEKLTSHVGLALPQLGGGSPREEGGGEPSPEL